MHFGISCANNHSCIRQYSNKTKQNHSTFANIQLFPLTHCISLLTILFIIGYTNAQDMYIDASPTNLNAVANYTLTIGRFNYNVSNSSTLALTFPKEYNSTALHSMAPYNASITRCFPVNCSSVSIIANGSTLFINGVFPGGAANGSRYFLNMTIFNIKNPGVLTIGSFVMTVFKSGSTLLGGLTCSSPTFTLSSLSYSVSVLEQPIWGYSPVTFTFVPDVAIDTLVFNFPSPPWINEAVSFDTLLSSPTCTSNSNPTIVCTFLGLTMLVTNLSYYNIGTAIDLTVNLIANPTSMASIGNISVTGQMSGSDVTTANVVISSTNFTTDYFRSLIFTVTYQSSDKITISISFSFSHTSMSTDLLELTFPPEIVMSESVTDYTIIVSYNVSSPLITFTTGTQSLSFYPFLTDSVTRGSLSITIANLVRPRECKTTGKFSLKTYRAGQFLMDNSTCCAIPLQNRVNLSATTPSLSTNSRLITNVTYQINITTVVVNLITTDQIRIEFPVEFSPQINAANNITICSGVTITAINNSSNINTRSCDTTLNSVLLYSFLKANLLASQTFQITFTGLTNPSKTPLTGFNIATLSSAGYVLQEVRGLNFLISTSNLTAFSVTPASRVTSQADVLYTFTIGNNANLSMGYSIKIVFPTEYRFINYSSIVCTVSGTIMPCGRLNSTYNSSTHTVLITINGTVPNIGNVTISSVTNPICKGTTGNFSAYILDLADSVAESNNNSATLTIDTTNNFPFFLASTYNSGPNNGSRENVATTINTPSNKIWIYIATSIWSSGRIFTLNLLLGNLSQLSYNGSSYCYSSQFTTSFNFSMNSTQVQVTLSNISLNVPTNYIYLQVSNITIKNSSSLPVSAYLSVDGAQALATSTPVKASNLYVQQVSSYSITQTSYVLGATGDVNIAITLSSITAAQASNIEIYIPQQFGLGGYSNRSFNSSLVNSSLSLTGLINPTTKYYTPFLFVIYDASSKVIAVSLPNNSSLTYSFKLGCSYPCQNCTNSSSNCSSCYTSIWWISEIYLSKVVNTTTYTCTDKCLEGYYLNNGTCSSCNINCKTCMIYGTNYTNGSPTTCLSCNSTMFLLNSICYSSCPQGYYASGTICSACQPNCFTCTTYNQCSSCSAPFVFYANKCLLACPGGYVNFLNSTDNRTYCVGCPTNCKLCSSSASPSCIKCDNGYYLSNGTCVSVATGCPAGKYPDLNDNCTTCQCQNCSGKSYNCTGCSGLTSLYLNQCLNSCPTGYYSLSKVCTKCANNCAQCNSTTYCIVCQLPSVLYLSSSNTSQCLTSCPNGTIPTVNTPNFTYICKACTNCLTCTIRPTYCTSCVSPFVLSNHTCVSLCPSDQFLQNGICVYCYSGCDFCNSSNASICYVCSAGYFRSGTSCVSSCNGSNYANVTTLSCAACDVKCATCQNSTNCSTCFGNQTMYNGYCYPSCAAVDPNLRVNQGVCMYCQTTICISCVPNTTSPYACTSCKNSLHFYNPTTYECTISCTLPYYADSLNKKCVPCDSSCATCDTSYKACQTCQGQLVAYQGNCSASCPVNYYNNNGICQACGTYCYTCNAARCLVCMSYAYLYHMQCVLDCSLYSDLPIAVTSYCTSCAQVPYCQSCSSSGGKGSGCFVCVYPYVLFNGNCLNECPQFYEPDSDNQCQVTASYSSYLVALQQQNKPKLPPFAFLTILVLLALIMYLTSRKIYRYTYHLGYFLALISVIDFSAIIYGIYYTYSYYQGDYALHYSTLPLWVIIAGLTIKITLGVSYGISVLYCYYFQDRAYQEWRAYNKRSALVSICGGNVFGPRFNKLFYSKLWGKDCFSYRIISVQKFYREDIFNWFVCLSDIVELSGFFIITYNIFVKYAVLYLLPFELIIIKMLGTLCFMADLKKPDRGFFKGDEQLAEQQILEQQLAKQNAKRKFQIQSLAKMIRCRSAQQLHHQKLYQFLFFDDVKSVYDPKDYEDPPVVPKKKILKNIERGRFRKGKKISMEQKLRRFAQSIKPRVQKPKDDAYFNKLLYWKPPKAISMLKKQNLKQADESMLNLLKDKQLLYEEDIERIQIEELQFDTDIKIDRKMPHRSRKRTTIDYDQETIGNVTFYDPSSVQLLEPVEPEEDYYVNGLLNRNYAQKKHLPVRQHDNSYDQQQLRILRHSPQKKRQRRSKLNDLSIRRG